MEEYEIEEESLTKAVNEDDVDTLSRLLGSRYRRIANRAAAHLYTLDACPVDAVIQRISCFKDDDPLVKAIEFSQSNHKRGNSGPDVARLLAPELFEDFLVFTECFSKVLRSTCLSVPASLRILNKAQKHMSDDVVESSRRGIANYLLQYCAFKINRRPADRKQTALDAVSMRPPVPYPEEHRELLLYLASLGINPEEHGYDEALHGQIAAIEPVGETIDKLITRNSTLEDILRFGTEGILALLHRDYIIDFATRSYGRQCKAGRRSDDHR